MKYKGYEDLHVVLQKICEAVFGNVQALNYSQLANIHGNASQSFETRVAIIGSLKRIIDQIKSACNDDERAFFEFYFEYQDNSLNEDLSSLFHLSRLVYSSDLHIAALIVKKFRDKRVSAQHQISKKLGCHVVHAHRIIKNGQLPLTELLNKFINTDYLLASEIESILIANEIISPIEDAS